MYYADFKCKYQSIQLVCRNTKTTHLYFIVCPEGCLKMATRGKYKPDSGRLEGEKEDHPLPSGMEPDDGSLRSTKILAG